MKGIRENIERKGRKNYTQEERKIKKKRKGNINK